MHVVLMLDGSFEDSSNSVLFSNSSNGLSNSSNRFSNSSNGFSNSEASAMVVSTLFSSTNVEESWSPSIKAIS